MSNFDNPSAAPEQRIVFHLLNFFASLFYERDILSVFYNLLRRFSGVAFVSAQMLDGVRSLDDDLVKHEFKLAHIVSVCSGYDYR